MHLPANQTVINEMNLNAEKTPYSIFRSRDIELDCYRGILIKTIDVKNVFKVFFI